MSAPQMTSLSMRGLAAAVTALALTLGGLAAAAPAAAATTITVGTTADTDANGACANPGVTTPASPTSLRNALCVASNLGGTSTITVPAGTYTVISTLELGTTAGTDVTLASSGGQAKIVGNDTFQLLALDPALVGDVKVTIDGFSFSRGRDAVFGGAAIIAGANDSAADTLVVAHPALVGIDVAARGSGTPGGAIQFIGGDLTITDSTFDNNSAGASSGGAVYYEARNSGDAMLVSGSTFTSNSVHAAGGVPAGGGAIAFDRIGPVSATVTIGGNTFRGNSAVGTPGAPGLGGAIRQLHGPAFIDSNLFAGNSATGAGSNGSAISATGGPLGMRFNSIAGNTGAPAVQADASTTAVLSQNWWGCNTGASGMGCDTATFVTGTTTPYLMLIVSANASSLTAGQTATLTASLLTDSSASPVDPSKLGAFAGRTITWSSVGPAGSAVAPSPTLLTGGVTTATYTAGSTPGVGGATAVLDSGSFTVPMTIRQNATFTSPDTLAAVVGTPVDFTVTTSGYPVPTVTGSGSLPNGLSIAYNGATAHITGTPLPGSTGSYPLALEADNGAGPVQQTLTITVGQLPAFTSALSTTVEAGSAVDLTISASGVPTPAISVTGGMPPGLTLDDNHDGTARLHGTPTVPAGSYSIGLSAVNAVGTTPGTFTLQLTASPAFTSADQTTFSAGTPGSFAVTVDPGFPAHAEVAVTGAPAWLSLGGAPGSQTLTGTPPAGSGGVYSLTLSIVGSSVTQSFSLRVNEAPVITQQPSSVNVVSGSNAVFQSGAFGYPAPTVQWQRFIGGAWTDIPGATSTTLMFPTSMSDTGARVRAVFTSTSGTATTNEGVLSVGQVPGIPAIDPVTAPVGSELTIPITTTGLPRGTITATGVPAWLTFTDLGNGTATLVGTPALADAGTVTIGLHVSNGFGTADTTVQVTAVGSMPQFTGVMSETVAAGDAVDVTITTGGVPTSAITAIGALPNGLVLTDNHDGTARLHGTADAGPGPHAFSLSATNIHGSTFATFTLTITAPPRFLSASTASSTVGLPIMNLITIDPGYPALTSVSMTGAPSWLALTPAPGPQLLIGLAPAGAGGTYTFELSIVGSTVVQEYTLTVNEAPVVSLQPLPKTVVDGDTVTFMAAATGYPVPTVKWQRLIGGTWTDIAGATSPTLSFAAGIADNGAKVRALFSNGIGDTASDEVVLTVGQLPVFTPIAPVTALAGGALTVDITATGLPSGTITASGVPAWLTFTDAGDGTATLTGTPVLADAGTFEVPLHVDNGFGTADLTVRITVETAVPLPYQLPSQTDGALTGVPGSVVRGQQITIGGSGFLPGAPIRIGMYSVPAALGTAVADQTGAFTAVVTIPADMTAGAHTIAAAGIGADGTARLLASGTTVSVPVSGGSSSGGLATTGVDGSGTIALALLALFSMLVGFALIRRARRRMV
ncbi:MAG: immunoglobulin domain-containing protein [Microbacterium sp.]|nr:immunoglobulin domain-containing protein [Microbacterium sp.]